MATGSAQVGHASFTAVLAETAPAPASTFAPDLDDEALIVYTSGTTGHPKGVVLTQYNLLVDAGQIAAWHEVGPGDRMMCVLPIHHVNGTVVTLLTPLVAGGTAVLNHKFQTDTFFARLAAERIKVVSVVPTLLAFLLQAADSGRLSVPALPDFSHIICGAGPLTVELALRFQDRFGLRIVHGYGLSETTCYSCFLPLDLTDDEQRAWLGDFGFPSIGLPLPANEMDIHDTTGRPVPAGERGEIVIRGHNVMTGYFRNDPANAEAFAHGWFRSGDEGFCRTDDRGRRFFFITGRLKELIIRGGVNVSPLEIDEVLMNLPGVQAGVAVGFANDVYGEEVGAYVVLEDGASADAERTVRPPAMGRRRPAMRSRRERTFSGVQTRTSISFSPRWTSVATLAFEGDPCEPRHPIGVEAEDLGLGPVDADVHSVAREHHAVLDIDHPGHAGDRLCGLLPPGL